MKEPPRHVKKTLPPSMTGFPGEVNIRYFVKVTVQRPAVWKENWRHVSGQTPLEARLLIAFCHSNKISSSFRLNCHDPLIPSRRYTPVVLISLNQLSSHNSGEASLRSQSPFPLPAKRLHSLWMQGCLTRPFSHATNQFPSAF
jgi:hypothetical protein